ncbi:MAG TPA: NADH-quinone oxidoreductase subunit H, partial [Actinomycetes bacterium]|nr:NADH-quinone oxidoreductase subunit H [Actinomycetes bacterium]
MSEALWDILILLVKVVGVFAALMVTVLITIWIERRVVAFMQTRVGPNRVGPFGILQSLADGIKLFFKEDVRPSSADKVLYAIAPVIMMIPAFLAFTVIPFGFAFGSQRAQLADLNVGLLFVLAMGSLQVYGIVLAGWASGSNYPLLGAVRSSAQMISYEIAQGLSLVGVFMTAGTLSAAGIVAAQAG